MTSVFAFFVWCLTGNFTVHKRPLPTTRSGLQSRDLNHSRCEFWKNALPTFLVGENTWPASWLVGRTRDWLTGYDVRGHVLLSWPGGWSLKTEKPGPVCSEDESPGRCRSEVGCSAGCALKPVSWPSTALTTDTSARSTRVGLRVIKDEVPSM